jgi:hypothetical protein
MVHHWQAIYRRVLCGGPVLTAALSGIDTPLGTSRKALGCGLRAGPPDASGRVYAHVKTPPTSRRGWRQVSPPRPGRCFAGNPRYIETPAQVAFAVNSLRHSAMRRGGRRYRHRLHGRSARPGEC